MVKISKRDRDEAVAAVLYRARWQHVDFCLYCGEPADTVDHVLPISFASIIDWRKASIEPALRRMLITVPACFECNVLAGKQVFDSFHAKRAWLHNRIRKRYEKVLSCPAWSEEEIAELGDNMKRTVVALEAERRQTLRRLHWPNKLIF